MAGVGGRGGRIRRRGGRGTRLQRAAAGLPPLNGFVSEWLLLQAFLFSPGLPHAYISMLVPIAAAAVALTAALAGYVMVKFYGVIFLGQPREAGREVLLRDDRLDDRAALEAPGVSAEEGGAVRKDGERFSPRAPLAGTILGRDAALGRIAPGRAPA